MLPAFFCRTGGTVRPVRGPGPPGMLPRRAFCCLFSSAVPEGQFVRYANRTAGTAYRGDSSSGTRSRPARDAIPGGLFAACFLLPYRRDSLSGTLTVPRGQFVRYANRTAGTESNAGRTVACASRYARRAFCFLSPVAYRRRTVPDKLSPRYAGGVPYRTNCPPGTALFWKQ